MQVEIKSVKSGKSDYGEYKCVELANGTKYFVGADKPPYKFINVGYVGSADIETAKSKKGTEYIKIFKQVGNTQPTQTAAQKPHQQANKPVNGAYKKDPAGINLDKKIQLYKNWTNVFNGCVELCKCGKIEVGDIITKSNEFFEASFKTISILGKPKESEPKQETKTEPKADEHSEVEENENEDIDCVPF